MYIYVYIYICIYGNVIGLIHIELASPNARKVFMANGLTPLRTGRYRAQRRRSWCSSSAARLM